MIAETKNTKAFYNTEIPCDWEVCSLGSLADKKKKWSFTGGPFGSNLKAEDYTEKGIRIIQLQNIGDGEFLDNYKIYTSDKKADELLSCNIYPGEIILSKMGDPVARGCFIPNEDKRYLMASDGIRVLPDSSRVDSFYLLSFINYSIFRTEAVKISTGSTRQRIGLDDLKSIKIPLPPIPEQKAIAQVLSTADAAIHTTEKIIAQKVLRKKWLMQQLLTGKKRLKGFGGEWKKLGAGEIFKSITKKGFADEELLSATQDRGMIPRTMLEGRVTMPTTGTEGFKLVEIGDFVISLRSFQGGLEYSYYRGLVSPAYTVLKPKKPINEEFYKQYFKSYEFIGRLATAVIGIRDGKQISYDDFCIVKIPYPSYEEQAAIAQVLQAADKEISLLKAKAEKLREQKKGLMQQLLTGKVRLKINNT
jgi:type I restriction enzyme, S subunit